MISSFSSFDLKVKVSFSDLSSHFRPPYKFNQILHKAFISWWGAFKFRQMMDKALFWREIVAKLPISTKLDILIHLQKKGIQILTNKELFSTRGLMWPMGLLFRWVMWLMSLLFWMTIPSFWVTGLSDWLT